MDNENLTTAQQQAVVMITPLLGKQRVMATVTITADDGEEITSFYNAIVGHIHSCLERGWKAKESLKQPSPALP